VLKAVPRLLWVAWKFHLKSLSLSNFFILVSILQPLMFATIAFYMHEAGARPGTLLYLALGAGLMGMWSSTLFGSGGAIEFQRWQGTLEIVVAAPPPLLFTMLPLTLATASIGLYAVVATLAWGALLFDMPLDIEHPLLFALSLPTTTVALGLLGLVLASTFVLYRHANAFSNMLEYPVWLVSGLLIPVSLLPSWAEPISWVLAPTWGVRAVRESALGGDPMPAIGMCLVLSTAYLAIGAVLMANFERLARKRATLALA
jgi:ABC-2 type transport system permease protein